MLHDEFTSNIYQNVCPGKCIIRIHEFIVKFTEHTINFIFIDNRERSWKTVQFMWRCMKLICEVNCAEKKYMISIGHVSNLLLEISVEHFEDARQRTVNLCLFS
jgi:hypothetical protein